MLLCGACNKIQEIFQGAERGSENGEVFLPNNLQVMQASASCSARIQFIEIQYSEKPFAASRLLHREAADLLSETLDVVVDRGSTLTLTILR